MYSIEMPCDSCVICIDFRIDGTTLAQVDSSANFDGMDMLICVV